MEEVTVGIRELKQNASEVVARVRAGDSVVVTDRGTPVCRMVPIAELTIDGAIAAGQATAARVSLEEMLRGVPEGPPTTVLSDILRQMRDDNRS
jgi:prevent-host-death family protein